MSISSQLLLQLVPSYVRGRVFATEFAVFTLALLPAIVQLVALYDRLAVVNRLIILSAIYAQLY